MYYDKSGYPLPLTQQLIDDYLWNLQYYDEYDSSGQLVIYTGLYRWSDGTIRVGPER